MPIGKFDACFKRGTAILEQSRYWYFQEIEYGHNVRHRAFTCAQNTDCITFDQRNVEVWVKFPDQQCCEPASCTPTQYNDLFHVLLLPEAPNKPDIGTFYVIAAVSAHPIEEYLDLKKGGAITGPARKYN